MRDPAASRIDPAEVGAGLVTALVGFTSSFAVVLPGLGAVGGRPAPDLRRRDVPRRRVGCLRRGDRGVFWTLVVGLAARTALRTH